MIFRSPQRKGRTPHADQLSVDVLDEALNARSHVRPQLLRNAGRPNKQDHGQNSG